MKQIYMDHSATTQISEKALEEMIRCYKEGYGNPSAIYPIGQTAKRFLEDARNRVAKAIGALSTEVFFTSGGTESDNWVLEGIARQKKKGHIITSAVEHNAVLRTLSRLEETGFSVTCLEPDQFGRIAPEQLESAIRPDSILVSIMLANNVVGTVQDIPSLVKVAHNHQIPFHTDAVQAVGHLELNVQKLGIDYLSLSSHKFHGPKGVGALFCRMPSHLPSLILGGGQERGKRAGTENVPGIVGMTAALEECMDGLKYSIPYLTDLRKYMINGLKAIPGIYPTGDAENRLPGLVSVVVDGIPHSSFIVSALGQQGICISSGSACSASSQEASHVLQAMGYDEKLSKCALRFSLDVENTREEVDHVLEILPSLIENVRKANLSL